MKQHPTFLKSFGYAARGWVSAVKSERNIRIHLAFTALVVLVGVLLKLVILEWVAVILCCTMVLAAELMNTAVETIVDLVSPGYNELAGRAKDIAAASVWVVALFAALIGVLVFWHATLRWLAM